MTPGSCTKSSTESRIPERNDILNIGGFSDAVFNVVSSFLENDASRFVREVKSFELYVERRTEIRNARGGAIPRWRSYLQDAHFLRLEHPPPYHHRIVIVFAEIGRDKRIKGIQTFFG